MLGGPLQSLFEPDPGDLITTASRKLSLIRCGGFKVAAVIEGQVCVPRSKAIRSRPLYQGLIRSHSSQRKNVIGKYLTLIEI
jgi:hypothetical protein